MTYDIFLPGYDKLLGNYVYAVIDKLMIKIEKHI